MPEPSNLANRQTLNSYSSQLLQSGNKHSVDHISNSPASPKNTDRLKYDRGLLLSIGSTSGSPELSKDRTFSRARKFEVSPPLHGSRKVVNNQKSNENLNDPILLSYRPLNGIEQIHNFDHHNIPVCTESLGSNQSEILNNGNNKYQYSFSTLNENVNLLQISQYDKKDASSQSKDSVSNHVSSYKNEVVVWKALNEEIINKNSNSSSQPQTNDGNVQESKPLSFLENMKKQHSAGLQNIGNTCFMNSALQCLAHCHPLLEYFLCRNYFVDINKTTSQKKGSFTTNFSSLLTCMWEKNRIVIIPSAFKTQFERFSPHFKGFNQEDAQEFLHSVLQILHSDINRIIVMHSDSESEIDEHLNDNDKAIESWKRYLKFDNSKIVDIFGGQLRSTLKCTVCGFTSVTFDPFWDISLPIVKTFGKIQLQDCLNLFTQEEILDGEEQPKCSKCRTTTKSIKKLLIHKFPSVLILHLKRFSQVDYYKLSNHVDFPISNLDMMPYATQSNRGHFANYNLYAVTHHTGTSKSGHYFSSCCHPITHKWYRYDDSSVYNINTADAITHDAYILFYELADQSSRL